MTTSNAMGSEFTVYVSEPWEFVSLHGAGPFTATAQAAKTNEKWEGSTPLKVAYTPELSWY
jgi:hypothetical protein